MNVTLCKSGQSYTFGKAVCTQCQHEWTAVLEDEAVAARLECPKCHACKSIFGATFTHQAAAPTVAPPPS